jgi:hypothetical protein
LPTHNHCQHTIITDQWPRRIEKIIQRSIATIENKKQQYALQMADEQVRGCLLVVVVVVVVFTCLEGYVLAMYRHRQ